MQFANGRRGARQRRAGGVELLAVLTLVITVVQAQDSIASCGCPGWNIPQSALVGAAIKEPVADSECPGCQMPEAISLSGGGYVNLGSLTYDDEGLTYAFWLYASGQSPDTPVFDFGTGPDTLERFVNDNNH
eukprot:3761387-Rhodomonas_salina.1